MVESASGECGLEGSFEENAERMSDKVILSCYGQHFDEIEVSPR
jgi:hypothetical protein